MGNLTVTKIKSLPIPEKRHKMYSDIPTLYLNVTYTGTKSWVQKLTLNGQRLEKVLGSFPAMTLEEARKIASENRQAVQRGLNPFDEELKEDGELTFKEAALKAHKSMSATWKNEKTKNNWMQRLERHVFQKCIHINGKKKVFGNMRVADIGRKDFVAVLEPIWFSKPDTGRRVRTSLKQTLEWCVDNDYIEDNIAERSYKIALPPMPAVKEHNKALPYKEVFDAVIDIRNSASSLAVKSCLEFTILTACRSCEAFGAKWSEIDWEERLWVIPKSRMKGKREHQQPLSPQAIDVLERVKILRDSSDLIFPSPVNVGEQLSDMTMTKLIRKIGLADRAKVHGFRGTFRTWAEKEIHADWAVKELCLAHKVGSQVERSYVHTTLTDKRRILMCQWGDYVTGVSNREVLKLCA